MKYVGNEQNYDDDRTFAVKQDYTVKQKRLRVILRSCRSLFIYKSLKHDTCMLWPRLGYYLRQKKTHCEHKAQQSYRRGRMITTVASIIHGADVKIFHLMAHLKLRKERREGKLTLRAAIMGGVPRSFGHLVKFVSREGRERAKQCSLTFCLIRNCNAKLRGKSSDSPARRYSPFSFSLN